MAPRANWKGHLKLAYVSCPIALYPASTKSERVSFNKVEKATGAKLKQQYINPVTDKVVESWDQGRGYEVAKGEYLIIEDEELDSIKLESSKTIDISSFVKIEEVDTRYYNAPYWIVPTDKVGQDAFALIRDSMKRRNVVAIATVMIARREHTIMLVPHGKGIMGMTLRFSYEVRDADLYFDDIPDIALPNEIHDMAAQVVDSKMSTFDPKKMVDRYENAVVDLIRHKQLGYNPKPKEVKQPATYSVSIKELLALTLAQSKTEVKPQADEQPVIQEEKPKRRRKKAPTECRE